MEEKQKPKFMKKAFWLSYDFGLTGNYSALFTFLDNHEAIDCGNGLAFFWYESDKLIDTEKFLEIIKDELTETIKPGPSDRIYLIWRDEKEGKIWVKGKFIFGNRKKPAWEGYASKTGEKVEDEAM